MADHRPLFAAALPASAACAATIAWGVDLLGLVPFAALGAVIFVNNLVVGLTLGPVLLRLVLPRVAAWHLLWTDVMAPPPPAPPRRRLGGRADLGRRARGARRRARHLHAGSGGGELFRFGVGSSRPASLPASSPLLLVFLASVPGGDEPGPPGPRLRGCRFRHRGAEPTRSTAVDLALAPGETVVLLGASGAGKSTLCLAANGLVAPLRRAARSAAASSPAGRDTREHPPRSFAADVGVIFQDFESQLFCTTVELEAAFGPENLGVPRAAKSARASTRPSP